MKKKQNFTIYCLAALAMLASPATLRAQYANHDEDDSDHSRERQAVKAYVKDGKLHFATRNENFHWWLDNRIYLDAAGYLSIESVSGLSSKANKDLEEDDGKFRFSNDAIVRRARLAFKAELYKKWFAEFDLDYAYDELDIKDMYLGYRFNDHLWIKAGQFKEPMSMESTTSSRYLQSVEHPIPVDIFASSAI